MAWQCDESGLCSADGGQVKYVGAAEGGDKKGNAMWVGGGGSGGPQYWEFDIQGPGGFWLGVTTRERFGPGYGMKGLFYGGPGNLSDGGSLVTGQWGPKFGSGDIIGMRLQQEGDGTSLAFSKNGKALGTAFDIRCWSGESFVPAVSLSGQGHAVGIRSEASPSLEAMQPGEEGPRQGLEGSWQMTREVVPEHVLSLEKEGEDYRVSARVGNSMGATLKKTDSGFEAGMVMSTKMMPPPHLMALEEEMGQLIGGITNLTREGGQVFTIYMSVFINNYQ